MYPTPSLLTVNVLPASASSPSNSSSFATFSYSGEDRVLVRNVHSRFDQIAIQRVPRLVVVAAPGEGGLPVAVGEIGRLYIAEAVVRSTRPPAPAARGC